MSRGRPMNLSHPSHSTRAPLKIGYLSLFCVKPAETETNRSYEASNSIASRVF